MKFKISKVKTNPYVKKIIVMKHDGQNCKKKLKKVNIKDSFEILTVVLHHKLFFSHIFEISLKNFFILELSFLNSLFNSYGPFKIDIKLSSCYEILHQHYSYVISETWHENNLMSKTWHEYTVMSKTWHRIMLP